MPESLVKATPNTGPTPRLAFDARPFEPQDEMVFDVRQIISVLRSGRGFVPTADTVVEAGDQVLLVLDSGLEDQITPVFAPN